MDCRLCHACKSKDLIAKVIKTKTSVTVHPNMTKATNGRAGDGLLDAMDLLGPKMAGSVQ